MTNPSGNEPLILVIEDEAPIRKFLRASLTNEGFRLAEASTGQEGLRLAASQPPDLVVLDLGLPDIDGLEVIQRLREWTSVPILVLSARGQESQKVAALDGGADDYLTKPFGVGELLARMRVALRHAARIADGAGGEESRYRVGQLEIDLAARRVLVSGGEVHFTKLEFRLLATLARHAGKVLTHRFLLKEVWGPQSVYETHYLRVFVANLRRKIEPDPTQPRYLLTEQGVGYRLASE
jgi:two-component system KDP operon response regulator KdpE